MSSKGWKQIFDDTTMEDVSEYSCILQNDSLKDIPYGDVTQMMKYSKMNESQLNQTSASILVQEDPGLQCSQILFSEFVNIFVSNQCNSQLWHEISCYEKACDKQVQNLEKVIKKVPHHHTHFSKTRMMNLLMTGERNTWRLLSSLFVEELFLNEDEELLTDEHLRPTDKSVITHLYDTSSEMRLAQIVIDWLEKNGLDDVEKENFDHIEYFGTKHIAWENTLRKLKDKETQRRTTSEVTEAVKFLNIDVSLRDDHTLHELDNEEDQRLIQYMFMCLRAGQLSVAQDLSGKAGQYWRAAILEGWKPYDDTNLNDPHSRKPIIGNKFRDIWKNVAWRAASSKNIPKYERAMYGALCGHLDSLKEVCTNWEDLLWANMRMLVDQRVEETLREGSTHIQHLRPLPNGYPEEKLTLETVFHCIEKVGIEQNFFQMLQKFLILRDTNGLIDTSHHWWKKGILSSHHLRSLTHLLLVLKRCGLVSLSHKDKVTDIFTSCVKETMERGDIDQVAWYCSILPEDLQVKSYVHFLFNIHDEHQRKHALHLASLVGLDTSAITSTVVSTIRLTFPGDVLFPIGGDDAANDEHLKVNAIDWLLFEVSDRPEALRQANAFLRSFLLSRKSTAAKTLFKKIPSDIMDSVIKLNDHTRSGDLPSHLQNRIREHLCYKVFLEAQESFADWFDFYHQKKPSEPPKLKNKSDISAQLSHAHAMSQYTTEHERWKKALDIMSKRTCEQLYNILLFPDGGWLVDTNAFEEEEDDLHEDRMEEDSFWSILGGKPLDMTHDEKRLLQHLEFSILNKENNRKQQLSDLRGLYIPQVTSLLQNILYYTNQYKECLQLADLIASEQHCLYKCFNLEELQRFLLKLQDSSKELLDMNLDGLGYSIN